MVIRIRFTVKRLIRMISGCMCKNFLPKLRVNVSVENRREFPIIFFDFLSIFPRGTIPKRIVKNLRKMFFFIFPLTCKTEFFQNLKSFQIWKIRNCFALFSLNFCLTFHGGTFGKELQIFAKIDFFDFSVCKQGQLPI